MTCPQFIHHTFLTRIFLLGFKKYDSIFILMEEESQGKLNTYGNAINKILSNIFLLGTELNRHQNVGVAQVHSGNFDYRVGVKYVS